MKTQKSLSLVLSVICLTGCDRILHSEETYFANSFSERKFRSLKQGMGVETVTNLIGIPLLIATQEWSEVWSYRPHGSQPPAAKNTDGTSTYNLFGPVTHFQYSRSGIVVKATGDYLKGDFVGLTKDELLTKIGIPTSREVKEFEVIYHYTKPGKYGTYKRREVHFGPDGKILLTISVIYYD